MDGIVVWDLSALESPFGVHYRSPNPVPSGAVEQMLKKKTLSESGARELIIKEAKYRIGCEGFTPVFTLCRVEPMVPAAIRVRIGMQHPMASSVGRPTVSRRSVKPSCGTGAS